MFLVIKRDSLLLFGLAMIFLLGAAVRLWQPAARPTFAGTNREADTVYVLDAGHGGEDGGAVSQDGAKESEINLAVAKRLDALLRLLGQNTLMTRDSDVSIYSDGAKTLHEKKASDLKNRVALVNGTENAILVSIHQNSLPSVRGVHGAQVFFGTVEPSAQIAASVQDALNESVNLDGGKREKKIDPSIYLMKYVDCPAILVECGFLSNTAEAARLQEPEYQKKLCAALAAGLLCAQETEREAP